MKHLRPLILLTAGTTAAWFATESSPPAAAPFDQLAAACVEILVDDSLAGSGFIASPEGHVITAAHVVDGAKRIEVVGRSVTRTPVELVAVDVGNDLALLRLPIVSKRYRHLRLAPSGIEVGQEAWLYGAPQFRHEVLIHGHSARRGAAFEYYGDLGHYVEIRHISGAAPPGTSGGPWVNSNGLVVGVQSGFMTFDDAYNGLVYQTTLRPIQRLLQTETTYRTPTLGSAFEEIGEQSSEYLDRFPDGTEGLVLRNIWEQGPMKKAGLEEMDLLISVNGEPLRRRDQLLRIVRSQPIGTELRLVAWRPGKDDRLTRMIKTVELK